jgi:hypothetical protein
MRSRLFTKAAVVSAVLAASVFSQTASISGTVSDLTSHDPINGAQVILREGSSGGGGGGRVWTPVDTVTVGQSGGYAFAALAAGTYQVAASADRYQSSTTQVTLTDAQASITNITLAAALSGTLHVYVGKLADSAAIVGATVTARTGGSSATPLIGLSAANGWVTFADASTATYTITASANGYAIGTVQTTLDAAESDTARVYLGVAASDAKVVKGTVKTATGTAIRALVVLTAGTGGTRITLTDSTDNTGAYLISSIPATYTSVRVRASAVGFASSEEQATLSTDTTTVDFVPASQATLVRQAARPSPQIVGSTAALVVSADGRVLRTSHDALTSHRVVLVRKAGTAHVQQVTR